MPTGGSLISFLFEGGMVRVVFFYLFVLFLQSLFGDHMTLFKPYIATSYPMKQQELATNARIMTGAAPLYKAFGPSVFIKWVKTNKVFLNTHIQFAIGPFKMEI